MIDENFERKTRRLLIRPYKSEDYLLWKKTFLNLPPSKNHWDPGPRTSTDLTKRSFNQMLSRERKQRRDDHLYVFVAFCKKSGDIIGRCTLMDISRGVFQNAYLGYGVLSTHWRQGFGKEMVTTLLAIAFKDHRLHRV